VKPPPDLRKLLATMLDRDGIDKVANQLKLTPETVYRIVHGHDVRSSSVNLALAQLKLAGAKAK
jgi:hypothetical protein